MYDTLLHILDDVKYGLLLLPLMIWAVKEWLHRDHRSDKNLRGRVALVTGGSVGIGYETALELARRGAEVVVASRSLRKVGRRARRNTLSTRQGGVEAAAARWQPLCTLLLFLPLHRDINYVKDTR